MEHFNIIIRFILQNLFYRLLAKSYKRKEDIKKFEGIK